jgi:UDP-2,4-diacetamido-2,4,6-trideoxy-beta-L-altropyranose hydrolase
MINAAFRLEGSEEIGLGHVMRCLTLADRLKKNQVNSIFISSNKEISGLIQSRGYLLCVLSAENLTEHHDAKESLEYILHNNVSILVVDHYQLSHDWESIVVPHVSCLAVIDDLVELKHQSDIVINSNPLVKKEDYARLCSNQTRYLLGCDYVLLGQPFIEKRKNLKVNITEPSFINNILISIGATDPKQYSIKVLDDLEKSGYLGHVDLVLSSSCQWIKTYSFKDYEFSVSIHIGPSNLSSIIVQSDLAVGSIGNSSWERNYLGLPSIVLITADNQKSLAEYIKKNELAYVVDESSLLMTINLVLKASIQPDINTVRKNGLDLFDGNGACRIAKEIFSFGFNTYLISEEDCLDLFQWQNQTGAREFSRNPDAPSLKEHNAWFKKAIANPRIRMWIITLYDIKVGYVRLDDQGSNEEISILIDNRFHGLSIAKMAINFANKQSLYENIIAHVHPDNIASIRVFTSCGYHSLDVQNLQWRG